MGLSLGGMLTWMFGAMFPDFMDALVPVASQPGPMSGRNWIQRRINVEAIRNDPEWNGGDYETQPTGWARVAPLSALMHAERRAHPGDRVDAREGRRVLPAARRAREEGRRQQPALPDRVDDGLRPVADLEKIKARLLAINFADDAVNPPELGVLEAGDRAHSRRALRRWCRPAPQSARPPVVDARRAVEEPSGGISGSSS